MKSTASPAVAAVVILKTDRLYAEFLRQYTSRAFPGAVIDIVTSVEAAAMALARRKVDFFVAGIGALEGNVLDLLWSRGTHRCHARRVLVVTARREHRLLNTLRALEIEGVFDSATEAPEQLAVALGNVSDGARYWSASILQHMQRMNNTATFLRLLTAFEEIVLSVIGAGCDDTSAARELGVSPSTVSTVRRDLHRKLGVQHRGDLVRVAAQQGFVSFTPVGIVRPGFAMLTAAYHARRTRHSEQGITVAGTNSTESLALSTA